jgi:hypothetical protein
VGYYVCTLIIGYGAPLIFLALEMLYLDGNLSFLWLSQTTQSWDTWVSLFHEVASICISARIVGQYVYAQVSVEDV